MATQMQMDISRQATVIQMIHGMCVSRCVSLVAELGIPDILANGPQNAADIAQATATDPDALYRVMRVLSRLGVFTELPDGCFQNGSLSDLLRSDSPGTMRHYARFFGSEIHWRLWGELDYSMRTGKPSICSGHPDKTPFEVLALNPADQETFNLAMSAFSSTENAFIVGAYDFSQFARIIDVGGGEGSLAMLISESAPRAKVTVFDLPQAIARAKETFSKHAHNGRMDAISGNMFESVPGPADLCVLKHILHDFTDDASIRILEKCRKALSPGGRVVVCEMLIQPGIDGLAASILDIEMLVAPGGRERTEEQYAELFAKAGLHLERTTRTQNPITLLESKPVN